MKRLAAIFLFVGSVQLMSAQWTLQPMVTTANLWNVKFSDRNTGWILGQYYAHVGTVFTFAFKSSILRTTNAGGSWTEQIVDNCVLFRFAFVDRSLGWAVGCTRGNRGLLCKTLDGGATWTIADSSAAMSSFDAVCFTDKLHGWVVGSNDTSGILLRTTNGGASWDRLYHNELGANDLFFLNPLNGWMVTQSGAICRTADGGTSWRLAYQVPSPFSSLLSQPIRRIQFTDSLHGYAVGGIAGVETKVRTSDGGASWSVVRNTQGSSLHGLCMLDSSLGWTVGGANAGLTIQKTTDGGRTWLKQQYPMLGRSVVYFRDITFVNATEAWIVSDSGVVLKTTSGGATSIAANHNNDTPPQFQLAQNYPNPFNPTTTIRFSLSTASFVSLRVLDALGREVADLVSAELPAGTHFHQWNAAAFPSGVYFYRLRAGALDETRRLVLLR